MIPALMLSVTASISTLSPALAAPVFFSLGLRWSLMLNCFSFVVSLAAISFVRPRPPSGEGAPEHSRSFLREFAAGMQFFAGNSVLKTMLIAAVIVMLGAGAFNALSFFFLTENLHASPELFGIVGTTFGMGTLAGAILASAFASRLGLTRVFSYATVAVGVFVLVLCCFGVVESPGDRFGKVCFVKQYLALEIVQFDEIAIDDFQMPDAGAGEGIGNHGAGGAATDEQDA